VPEQGPVLVDTDVASALYLERYDLWIAACATANGLPLATLNRRHFESLTILSLTLL
jgi:predicted nucleic acid-binding protein